MIAPGYIGPVSFGSIDAWARRYGIDDQDEFEEFVAIIRGMDEAFLAHTRKQRPPDGDDGRDD